VSDQPTHRDLITYEVLTQLPDIESISSEWDSLLEQSPCNRAFSSSKWFLAACRAGRTISPHVLVARRGATIAGVLPLALTNDGKEAVFPSGLSDYNDMVARHDDDPVLAGLLEYAISAPKAYDTITLSFLRHDSNCVRALELRNPARDIERQLQPQRVCTYIDLPSSYEEYLATRARGFRKDLLYTQRLAHKNNIVVRQLDPSRFPPSQLPQAFLALHLSRFKTKSGLAVAGAKPFVRRLLPDLFADGRMLVFAVFEEERMIGIDLCLRGAKSLCLWLGGFQPEAKRWSPGKLLINAEIRYAYATTLAEYDFMRGTEAYKANWTNRRRDVGRLELKVTKYSPA
jgi:CelD/BcsL family acetyltransferase involved in cellulose biosynthesis